MSGYNGDVFRIYPAHTNKLYLDAPVTLFELQGIGMPPITKLTTKAPMQHGNTYLGMVWEPRPVTLSVNLSHCDHFGLWNIRQLLFNTINPLAGELWFQLFRRDGSSYTLKDVYFEGGLESGLFPSKDATRNQETFVLMAHDPIWYSAVQTLMLTEDGAFYPLDELAFPADFPIEFLHDHIISPTTIHEIHNEGNWYTWPVIVLVGPMHNFAYRNLTVGGRIQLAHTLGDGEIVTIITHPLHRSVSTAGGEDLSMDLTASSNMDLVYLTPDVYNGDDPNRITFFADDLDAGSRVIFYYNSAYIGV